jgi:hypothetical protein
MNLAILTFLRDVTAHNFVQRHHDYRGNFFLKLLSCTGCAMTEAVGLLPLTAEARFRFQAISFEICHD